MLSTTTISFSLSLFFFFIAIQLLYTYRCFRSPQSTEFPVLYSRFSLVIYFIHSSVSMSVPTSEFIPLLLQNISTHLFSASVSLFLFCKYDHLYNFSGSHVYVLIHDIYFSLFDLFHSVSL